MVNIIAMENQVDVFSLLVKKISNYDWLDIIFGGCSRIDFSDFFVIFLSFLFSILKFFIFFIIWPIENVWAYIKEKLEEEEFKNVLLLKKRIVTICKSITPAMCSKWINSIPKWLQALIKKKGFSINKQDYNNI